MLYVLAGLTSLHTSTGGPDHDIIIISMVQSWSYGLYKTLLPEGGGTLFRKA